jgi:hypothetical protein
MSALAELGKVWEEWGGVWGGRFGDEVHFEFPGATQHAARIRDDRESPAVAIAKTVGRLFVPMPLMTKEVPAGTYGLENWRCSSGVWSWMFNCK